MTPLEDLPLEEQVRILKARFDRAERALLEAETALEGRMRELDAANKELSRRESELAERLDIESRQLLAALSTARRAILSTGWAIVVCGGDVNADTARSLAHHARRDGVLSSARSWDRPRL